MPKPQSKHTFIFTAATHKQRSNVAAYAPHVGKNWRSEAVCRALRVHAQCVHCAKHAVCAILLLEAWRHILCLWGAAVKMKVCLDWGFGTREKEFVQACVCTSTNPKNKSVVLCLVGSSLEDESAFGLRFWQVQKGVCSSLCLHIHKPKKNSRTESGFFKKTAILSRSLICVPPFPQFNAGKGFQKKTAISAWMPACIGQQH